MTCLKAVFNSWSAIDRALLILHRIEKEEALRLGNKTQGNGANWFDIVGCQVGQSFTLVSLLGIFNTALKRNVVSSTQMALITFTPVLLQGARRISTKFSRRIDVISSCWGSLCLVADAVLLVAIFWLGNRVYPVVLLSVLGFGYLQKKVNGIALAKIQKWYLPVLKLGLSPLVFFMQKNFFLKQSHLLSFVFDLGDVAFVYKKLFSSNSYFYKDAPDLHLLNLKDFLSILQLDSTLRPILGPCKITLSDVVVNKEHVRVIPFPIVPEPLKYFTSIEDVWNSLKWKGDELIEKITGANREIEFKESKKEPQVYAKDLLDKLLRSIKDEAITTAAPLDYYMLKNQLGFIGKELKDLPEESTELKKTILLQLALEGAGVCGTGVYEQVETAANTLLMLSPVYGQRLTLKQRILIILHSLRRGIFENMYLYHQAIEESVIMRISGKVGDPHNKSVFLNVFASDFGLFDEGAQNDLFNPSDFWVKKIIYMVVRYLGHKTPTDYLWEGAWLSNTVTKQDAKGEKFSHEKRRNYEGYKPSTILDGIKDALGDSRISKMDIYDWAKGFIECYMPTFGDPLSTLSEYKLLEDPFGEGYYILKDAVLIAMLLDMGILSMRR